MFQFNGYDQDVSGDTITALLPIMEQEWRAMDDAGKSNFISYNKYDGSIELRMSVRFPGERYDSTLYYFIDPDDMPRTFSLLTGEVLNDQPSRDEASDKLNKILKDDEGVVRITGIDATGKELEIRGYYGSVYYAEVVQFLLDHLDRMVKSVDPAKGMDGLTVVRVIHEGYAVYEMAVDVEDEVKLLEYVSTAPYEPIGYGYDDFVLVLDLDKDEQATLWHLLATVGEKTDK